MELQNQNRNTSIKWEAMEFIPHKRSASWYIGFTIISLLLIAYAIYTHNFLTILTFIVLAGVWLMFSLQTPRKIVHELTTTGIVTNQNMLSYKTIKKFWIIYTRDNKTLNLETTAYLNNHLVLQLGKQHPSEVKEFLKKYIPEDLEMEESLTDIISRKIKF
jgi:hypothetical protein